MYFYVLAAYRNWYLVSSCQLPVVRWSTRYWYLLLSMMHFSSTTGSIMVRCFHWRWWGGRTWWHYIMYQGTNKPVGCMVRTTTCVMHHHSKIGVHNSMTSQSRFLRCIVIIQYLALCGGVVYQVQGVPGLHTRRNFYRVTMNHMLYFCSSLSFVVSSFHVGWVSPSDIQSLIIQPPLSPSSLPLITASTKRQEQRNK